MALCHSAATSFMIGSFVRTSQSSLSSSSSSSSQTPLPPPPPPPATPRTSSRISVTSLAPVIVAASSFVSLLLLVLPAPVGAIDCFTCTSLNRSNPGCHDPFHPTDARYVTNCMVPKEGHIGVFPAQYCVKLNGFSVANNVELTIRVCSLESMDNSCGMFRYQNEYMQGCISTCDESGCNSAPPMVAPSVAVALLSAAGSLGLRGAFNMAHL